MRSILVGLLLAVGCSPQQLEMASVYVKEVDVRAAAGTTIEVSAAESPELAGTRLVIPPGALARDERPALRRHG